MGCIRLGGGGPVPTGSVYLYGTYRAGVGLEKRIYSVRRYRIDGGKVSGTFSWIVGEDVKRRGRRGMMVMMGGGGGGGG